MKWGRDYHGCGEEYNMEKKGKQYHLPYNIRANGRNIKCAKEERDGNFREEIRFKKIGVGKNIKLWGTSHKTRKRRCNTKDILSYVL